MLFKQSFLKMLSKLSEEEKKQIKGILDGEQSELPPMNEEAIEKEEETIMEKGEEIPQEESKLDEIAKTPTKDPKESTEADKLESQAEEFTEDITEEMPMVTESPALETVQTQEEEVPEPQVAPVDDFSDIPDMDKQGDAVDEDSEESTEGLPQAQVVTDEQGAEMPLDYQQIIDSLNSKNAALEAENARLRAKTEGAFGYSAKPTGYTKVNALYDDAEDLHMHK